MRGYFPDDPTASAGKRRLSAFGPDIWLADGPTVSFFTFPYPTRMVLMRLGEGGLFVWSPIALAAELKAEVEAIGEPKFLVSPNKLHHLFLAEWKAAYPQAKLFASPGLRRRRRDLTFDADLIQALPRDSVKGWRGVLARLGGIVEPNPGAPGDWRASFLRRNAARAALARVLAWDIERVVIAHGAPVQHDGEAFVRRGFAWLADPGAGRQTKQGEER